MTESTYRKPTLDEFITRARMAKIRNSWVTEPGLDSLYVRYGSRYILTQYDNVLDIANITVEENRRGQGVFTNLVTRLRKDYPDVHIYVESVLEIRLGRHLLKMGFLEVMHDSFFLEAKKT